MAHVSDSLADCRGNPIKLIGTTGKKYKECVGFWIDLAKAPTRCFYNIIVEYVDPENPDMTYYDEAKAIKHNVTDPDAEPRIYIEAAFQQVPALGERLVEFARMCAKCRVSKCRELSDRIGSVLDREVLNLRLKGSSAEYRIIQASGLSDVVPPDEETADQ